MKKPRRNHSPASKARVALEALRGGADCGPPRGPRDAGDGLETELLENAARIFGGEVQAADDKERIRDLQAKIGELTMENFFEGALGKFPGPSGKR